ncbi:MAG: 23S rRNA (guanine(2445)-N(2))/(guanine(2069)-N(7))-methyltransferase, partial [Silvanigrellaceae bacterium]|nr:23S rRNA (guanine(2445)-N(2))/(guanine(2069)-N(7))-methyltransferase [Silvanigrellaceae bacterium]
MFLNRLKKNYNHQKKWTKRENITAFRIYDKDIPEYPFIVDYYDNSFVVYEYLHHDFEKDDGKIEIVVNALKELFKIEEQEIFFKSRQRQKGLNQYEKFSENKSLKIVSEGNLKFIVNLSDYLDTGLFLDHRETRKLIASWS